MPCPPPHRHHPSPDPHTCTNARARTSTRPSSTDLQITISPPAPSHLRSIPDSAPYPALCAPNHPAPGVPHLLQKKWGTIRSELETMATLSPFNNRVLRLNVYDEAAVAPLLDTLASEWGGEVAIGSYPVGSLSAGGQGGRPCQLCVCPIPITRPPRTGRCLAKKTSDHQSAWRARPPARLRAGRPPARRRAAAADPRIEAHRLPDARDRAAARAAARGGGHQRAAGRGAAARGLRQKGLNASRRG